MTAKDLGGPIGNRDASKRGRDIPRQSTPPITNPVTLRQVAERRNLAPQEAPGK